MLSGINAPIASASVIGDDTAVNAKKPRRDGAFSWWAWVELSYASFCDSSGPLDGVDPDRVRKTLELDLAAIGE